MKIREKTKEETKGVGLHRKIGPSNFKYPYIWFPGGITFIIAIATEEGCAYLLNQMPTSILGRGAISYGSILWSMEIIASLIAVLAFVALIKEIIINTLRFIRFALGHLSESAVVAVALLIVVGGGILVTQVYTHVTELERSLVGVQNDLDQARTDRTDAQNNNQALTQRVTQLEEELAQANSSASTSVSYVPIALPALKPTYAQVVQCLKDHPTAPITLTVDNKPYQDCLEYYKTH